jgi:23S rRNA pseudouridine1911/1915/1917 synthase
MRNKPVFDIVYEDNHIILVIKPFNMPTQSDESNDPDLLSAVKEYIKTEYAKPGNVYLGMVHRLDRPVGGLVLFAKTSKAAGRLSAQLRDREIGKEYMACVLGTPQNECADLVHYLIKDNEKNKVTASKTPRDGAKKAELRYETLRSGKGMSLLKVVPLTGRSHQIRAQLAAIGHPIAGDLKYGAREPLPGKNILLYAVGITFTHPVKNEEMSFDAPLPKDWPL